MTDTDGGTICIPAVDPGDPETEIPGTNNPGGGQKTCMYQGKKIPCVSSEGVWFSSRQCYARPMDPAPKPDDPVWGENDPTKGSMWTCGRAFMGGHEPGIWFFYVPGTETPPLVDPGELAQETLETMDLVTPEVRTAPAAPAKSFVNLETWFWAQESTFTTLTKSATAGGTTVTVTAKPMRIWWDLGDGEDMTCESAGRPWTKGLGDAAETDCGYTYTSTSSSEPGDVFEISAVVWYAADWTCSGACLSPAGSLGEVSGLAGDGQIEVGERQSVVVGSGQ